MPEPVKNTSAAFGNAINPPRLDLGPAAVAGPQTTITDMRCRDALHVGTDVGAHWVVGATKSGTSRVLSMHRTPDGVLMFLDARGKKLSVLVPWANVSHVVLGA